MNVLIIGAGAIGSLVGAKLAQGGAVVTLVGRPRWVEAVRIRGLRLMEAGQIQEIAGLQAVTSTAEAHQQGRSYAVIVLAVKSYDTPAALAELAAALTVDCQPAPVALSLQNGVGNEEAIAAVLGADRVLAGTITAPVTVPEPGTVLLEKSSYVIGLSPWHPSLPTGSVADFRQILQRAGVSVTSYTNPQGMKWTKLLMNMMANASCAILDEPPRQVFADPRMVDLEIAAWRETLSVMERTDIRPVNLEKYPFGWLAPMIRHVPKPLMRPILGRIVSGARGRKMPSLHIDLSRGRKHSEVAWLNGAVASRAQELDMAAPVNHALNRTLLHLVQHPDQWPHWRHNHQRLLDAANNHG